MTTVISDFGIRKSEINIYFNFIEKLDYDSLRLNYTKNGKTRSRIIDTQLTTILKANGFILLYNLIESTCRNCLSEVHDVIKTNNVDYGKLNAEMKDTWIRFRSGSFFRMEENKLFKEISSMVDHLIRDLTIELNDDHIKKQLSGNIDLQKIRKIGKRYGFPIPNRFDTFGEGLLKVKNNRNSLAHGLKSFMACGGEYTVNEMMQIKEDIIRFLNSLLKIVEKYILNKDYLCPIE